MPEYKIDTVTKEWLQSELRSPTKSLIVLDCRSSNEFQEGHIRSAVNFSIPSLILKRLATGKIDLTSTIKSRDLKQRIQNAYSNSLFILYNETKPLTGATTSTTTNINTNNITNKTNTTTNTTVNDNSVELNTSNDATTINVLHRRLKQDGCRVYCLRGMCIIFFVQYTRKHCRFLYFVSPYLSLSFTFLVIYLFSSYYYFF